MEEGLVAQCGFLTLPEDWRVRIVLRQCSSPPKSLRNHLLNYWCSGSYLPEQSLSQRRLYILWHTCNYCAACKRTSPTYGI